MRRSRWKWLASGITICFVGTFGVMTYRPIAVVQAASAPKFSQPECPEYGEWTTWFDSLRKSSDPGAITHTGLLLLPGRTTNVPEFHDCQRFIIESDGNRAYHSLTAIFARDSLGEVTAQFDSVPDGKGVRTKADSERVRRYGRPIAIGEIMSLDESYPQLGLKRGFSCLYLYGKIGTESGLEAQMVPAGGDDKRCGGPLQGSGIFNLPSGMTLQVRRNGYPKRAIPPVARWDWDTTNHQQFIGIACGSAWCQIGSPGFSAPAAYSLTATSPTTNILAVKGWYDEQRLSLPTGAITPPVSGVIGTLIPEPDLGKYQGTPEASAFTGNWVKVAKVAMSDASAEYKNSLNMERVAVARTHNQVSLCYGDKRTCLRDGLVSSKTCKDPPPTHATDPRGVTPQGGGRAELADDDPRRVRWWAKIESASEPRVKFYCVVRRGHEDIPNLHVPGVVRWRWAIDDETMWVRCLEGCCEVEAGHSDS